MNMNEYQQLAQRTANTKLDGNTRLAVAALGLAGESGEFAEIIKKMLGHGHAINREHAMKELGDCLWYLAECAAMIGADLDEIAELNIEKLAARYPAGFSEWRSQNRKEGDI